MNAACNRLSGLAWEAGEFGQYSLHKRFYRQLRDEFPLSAQVVVRLNAKVADAYKLDQEAKRTFRTHGSIAYDLRILSWRQDKSLVNIWTLAGRQRVPFTCGNPHRELSAFQHGESDLVYRDGNWFLFTTVNVPHEQEQKVQAWIGVDPGLVSIAHTSDGTKYSGAQVNNRRARNVKLRRKLQKKGTKSAKRLMRKRRRKERRFCTDLNHQISKTIVDVAKRTGRGIALEDLSGIRGGVRASKAQRRRLHCWGFDQLRNFVTYKARAAGVPLAFVAPRNTSRTCAECGHIDKRNRKTQAAFCCTACGHQANADAKAARVIAGRAAVNRPNVAGVEVSGVLHKRVAKRSLVTSSAL